MLPTRIVSCTCGCEHLQEVEERFHTLVRQELFCVQVYPPGNSFSGTFMQLLKFESCKMACRVAPDGLVGSRLSGDRSIASKRRIIETDLIIPVAVRCIVVIRAREQLDVVQHTNLTKIARSYFESLLCSTRALPISSHQSTDSLCLRIMDCPTHIN